LYLALLGLAVWLASASGVSCTVCPFKLLTGLPCATCGTTRAALALLTGRFADAWRWNPLVCSALLIAAPWVALRCAARPPRHIVVELSGPLRAAAITIILLAAIANWTYLIASGR
jgi:hypothetical protein